MRFFLLLIREFFLEIKLNWFRVFIILISIFIVELMEFGSIMGEEGVVGVMLCIIGWRRGYIFVV